MNTPGSAERPDRVGCLTSRSGSMCGSRPEQSASSWSSSRESRDLLRQHRYNAVELRHEEPTRGKGSSRMARMKRRQYGSGCLLKRGRGWAIRWRELEIAPDGTTRRALRYEAL